MVEVDLERLILPALLALLLLGAFTILVTSGGGSPDPGPMRTPAAKSSAAPKRAAAPTRRFIKVQQGDTASSIASAAGITVEKLADLNPSVDPNTLRPGQTLKLAP